MLPELGCVAVTLGPLRKSLDTCSPMPYIATLTIEELVTHHGFTFSQAPSWEKLIPLSMLLEG